ncbi:ParM/StbA family protein [Alkalibacillus haloalkaliphilus]|uniref:ParM/StbA family protein n=1 Tax=Alkalibacillus haloalkaliphilus TaxID=94136 RepID=UPI00293608D1|nr:ParM/StbA family protein [Alkalibacillus haloalkaliphilus]MDV2581673.1 ParM/StbA family protein [Alkalibacillus haloalkaliphilus]
MKQAFIAIDTGKHTTKSIMEVDGKQFISNFRTKVQKVNNAGIEVPHNSFLVNHGGAQYLVGDIVSEQYSDHSLSKQIINHKIAIYTTLLDLELKSNFDFRALELNIIVNAPTNVYKDAKAKQDYYSYIYNDGQSIRIDSKGKMYTFKMKNLTIAFEGVGMVFAKTNEYLNMNSLTIDIGGLNTTLCQFNGLKPDFNSMIVSNLGISSLKSNLENAITERHGFSVSPNDLENILQDGFLMNEGQIVDKSEEMINSIKENHVDAIINYAKQHGYTFNNRKMSFVGGGSFLLRDQLIDRFPLAEIAINPQFANVKSFLSILKVKHQNV